MPKLSAISIARPLVENRSIHAFSGQIFGVFANACNVIEAHHNNKIIALSSAKIPKGPFSIIVEDAPHFFDSLRLHQPLHIKGSQLMIGEWHIQLDSAQIWESKISWPPKRYIASPAIAKILEPWTEWPKNQADTAIIRTTAHLARQAANNLQQALRYNQNIEDSVTQLAGLGNGLTPAGDDYLLGVIVALWLTSDLERPLEIARIAAPKTTTLSAAFLTAAGQGKFIEPWHLLVQALVADDKDAISKAVNDIAQFGASSGIDALAGFAKTLSR